MTGIAWTLPTPVGETVPLSTGLGTDLSMMNWERITDKLKTAFPQQTRYLTRYKSYDRGSIAIITAMKHFREA